MPEACAHAAIDVGTNSVHLVVARISGSGRFDVLAQEKEVVRLGSGSGDMKELTPAAMDRGVATLRRFRQVAEIWTADVAAVATSAVREADNRDVFVRRAREEAGVEVDVISGVEEARLIRLGALQAVPVYDRPHLVVDIGGGSTEFVVGHRSEMKLARSLKLGAVRLTERFFPGERTRRRQVEACRQHVRAYLTVVARDVRAAGFDAAVGCSGTIQNLAQMVAVATTGVLPASMNAFAFDRARLSAVVEDVVTARTAEARSRIGGLEPRRVDIIVAGAVLLEQIMIELDIDEMVVSTYALREGVLLDRQAARPDDPLHHLTNPRQASVGDVAAQFDPDIEHSQHATDVALAIFDQLAGHLGRRDADRDTLEAAGRLHNVGLTISHASHHRHSYYVIRHSELLTGFTDHEIELIAQVARYHRKSAPKVKHPEFAALDRADQDTVRLLAGILRVAIGLDRTHSGVVRSVSCHIGGEGLTIEATTDGRDASLELYTAEERRDLLAEAIGMPVHIVLTTDPLAAVPGGAPADVSRHPAGGGPARS